MEQTASPLVSVIIPAYDVSEFIGEALDSVLAQTFTDYEIIVINDGSPDTEALERALKPYMSRIVYLKQENRGVSAARNTGIEAARGSLIAFLDGDDTWLPNYLEVQVARIQADPTIDVLYPNVIMFGDPSEAGEEFMTSCPSNGEVTFERLLLQECNVSNCSIARRETIIRAGLFDESLRSVEDFDLWLRVIKQGGRIAYHRDVLARYRRRTGSLTADPIWLSKHILRVLEKVRETMRLTPSELETVDLQQQRFHALLRLHEGKRAFFSGDTAGAIHGLTEANRFFRNRKTAFTLMMLRIAPGLLLRAYDLRDRFYFRMITKY
ncbi:MAG TPA: glycosyltransferase family A protein [Pyrinomonadaceae bacterium]|nr:glycosyltransferase family A protein [Pyrinomonadaceae bacterium]